jgi:type VI secretion system protein ImpH
MASEKRQSDDTLVEYEKAPITEFNPRGGSADPLPVYATPPQSRLQTAPPPARPAAREPLTPLNRLLAVARESEFFSLVARIERLTRAAVRVGGDGPVDQELIRFRHDPSMAFSASDVTGARTKAGRGAVDDPLSTARPLIELTTSFLGVTGSASPVPLYLASEIAQAEGDAAITRAFLDIFHHRIISLFYRLWMRYQYVWECYLDRTDRWPKRALALGGLDTYLHEPRRYVPVSKTMRVLPLLIGRARTAQGLRLMIKEYLREQIDGAEVAIGQFIGGWALIAKDQQMALGQRNCQLGKNALIGTRIFDQADRFLVRIGPINAGCYQRLTSDKKWLSALREAVELSVRVPMGYDVELILSPDARPGFKLSSRPTAALGRDAFLAGKEAFRTVRVAVERGASADN